MSNQQNDTYYENYYEMLEEIQEVKDKTARRHLNREVKPFNQIMNIDGMIYKSILNLNK